MHEIKAPFSEQEIHPLTSLRGLAALFVILLHYNQSVDGFNFYEIAPFIAYGHTGVDVFFFLSGYILTYVYGQKLSSFSWRGALNFMGLRLARIYPAHMTALIAVVALFLFASFVVGYQFNDPKNWVFADLIYSVTLTHAWGMSDIALWNGPSWSVSSEWMAYLIFPFVLPVVLRLGRAFWVLSCLSLLVAIWWVYGAMENDLAFSFNNPVVIFRILSEFWLGSMLFLLAGHVRSHIGFDALVVGILALFLTAPTLNLADYELIMFAPLLILALHKCSGPISRVFSLPFFVFLGRISYSVYIIHFPVNMTLKFAYGQLGIRDMGFSANGAWYLGMIVVTMACGWVLCAFVEVPARRALKSRLSTKFKPVYETV